jgi:uncharacterized OB-fold protein
MSELRLDVVDAPVAAALGHLLPPVTAQNAPFFDALLEGRLVLQRCGSCGRVRASRGPVCPHCGSEEATWQAVNGRGAVHSWIRYLRSYLPELESLLPYIVLCVELAEGVRVFGRLREEAGAWPDPYPGMPVEAIVERWSDGIAMYAFTRAERSRGE